MKESVDYHPLAQTVENTSELSGLTEKTRHILSSLNEVAKLLRSRGLDFSVIGGCAVIGHVGKVIREPNKDFDLLIDLKQKDLFKDALESAGFKVSESQSYKLVAKKDGAIQIDLGFIENEDQGDYFFVPGLPELKFPKAFLHGGEANLVLTQGESVRYPLATKEFLYALKCKSARDQDKVDSEQLREIISDQAILQEIEDKYGVSDEAFKKMLGRE